MRTFSADETHIGYKSVGVVEDLTCEIYGEDKPFTYGVRDKANGMFFLFEEDCVEMEEGLLVSFKLNHNGKISSDGWSY